MDPADRAHPSGVPLSRSLIIRPGIANDELREAVAAINRVHGDGELPTIPVSLGSADRSGRSGSADGWFSFEFAPDGSVLPRSILVRSGANDRQFILIHEIGHLIDAAGLPGVGFSSASPDAAELDSWREAVARSEAVARLVTIEQASDPQLREAARRLLQADELWARSYAQWITTRGGSAVLRDSLQRLKEPNRMDVYLPRQWSDDDFDAIGSAIDETLGDLGWMEWPRRSTSSETSSE